jgi:hypothetical protein
VAWGEGRRTAADALLAAVATAVRVRLLLLLVAAAVTGIA